MNRLRGIFSRIARPPAGVPEHLGAQMEFLREARRELQSYYPRVRPLAVVRLLRRHGLRQFPDGFFLHARPSIAFFMLLRVALGRHHHVDWHPLFSSFFYTASNPDLEGLRASPWMHYQVFGRAEGRTPHPLIDTEWLASGMSGVRRGELVDEYFANPIHWLVEPSSYVDAQSFLVNGPWDGGTHPLKEIVSRFTGGPWIRSRLMLTDVVGYDEFSSLLNASGVLLLLAGNSARTATMKSWSFGARDGVNDDEGHTVIPGYFLGTNGHEILSSENDALSPDSTMIRHGTGFVSIFTGPQYRTKNFVYLGSEMRRRAIDELLHSHAEQMIIAPHSVPQEIALNFVVNQIGRKDVSILKFGDQAHVFADSPPEIIFHQDSSLSTPEWGQSEVFSGDVTIVLSAAQRGRAASEPSLREMIERGATLCVVTDMDVEPWLHALSATSSVLVSRELLELICGIANPERLFVLPSAETGSGR